MDYQIKEGVSEIRTELKSGILTIVRSSNHLVRIRSEDINENCMRVFAYNNVLHVKCLSSVPVRIELQIPESVRVLNINSEGSASVAENLEVDRIVTDCRGEIEFTNVTIKKSCKLSVEYADIILRACDIKSMNIELMDGNLDFQNTVLHGNNTAFLRRARVNGKLQGALVDYVVSAGPGVDADNVIVNEHLLSEFPNRKNTQNCAWLMLAGSLKNTARLTIQKPRMRY